MVLILGNFSDVAEDLISEIAVTHIFFSHCRCPMTQIATRSGLIVLLFSLTVTAVVGAQENPTTQPSNFLPHESGLEPATVQEATDRVGSCYFNECGGCGSCQNCSCLGNGILGRGLIKKSEHCFDDFISPMTNPVFFEDPRQLTELRPIFFTHKLPLAAGGGNVQLYALQIRARLSEKVSLIATKDGYVTSNNALVDDGWADVALGLKFSLLRDVAKQRLLSGGFTFELPVGSTRTLQGNGDGEFNLFLSGGTRIGCKSHWLTATGFRLPVNPTDESTSWYWSNHLDRKIAQRLYLFTEANWYHWLRAGQDGPVPGVEGLDVFNFGSPGVAGNDIVTGAFGLKVKPRRNSEVGVAFEFPLTEREDIIDNRLTVDAIIRY